MAFLFRAKQKSPQELAKGTKDAIIKLQESLGSNSLASILAPTASVPSAGAGSGSSVVVPPVPSAGSNGAVAALPSSPAVNIDRKALEKLLDEISKNVAAMKIILYGDGEIEVNPELVSQLSQEIYQTDLLQLFVVHLNKFEFEAKKDVVQIFNNLLRRQIGSRAPTIEYISTREDILVALLNGYENQDIALHCGMIMRECIRHESLAKIIVYSGQSEYFYKFFAYVDLPTFDISSDAFATFKDLLTRHKALISSFLEKNHDLFFGKYTALLNSNNYATKRQSIKLLGELLLDRSNFNTMTQYISSAENLKLMMNLLRDRSKNIQYEAFHVFKVFVANPNKPPAVLDILKRNQERLLQFLSDFHNDRNDDEQFNDEKAFIIRQIRELQ